MPLLSPRFAGNPLLESIHDDPDTGTLKLGPGSPATEVYLVQQALADLGWPPRAVPPSAIAGFADGDFGSGTSATVLAFKSRYDIHYPPSTAAGFIDHYVGPRTLDRLDKQIANYDEAIARIGDKISELLTEGHTVDAGPADDPASDAAQVWLGHPVVYLTVTIDGVPGAIYDVYQIGTIELHGPTYDFFLQERELHGIPIAQREEANGMETMRHEHTVILHDLASGAVYLEGSPLDPGY